MIANPQLLAVAIFLVTYLFIILFYHRKTPILWAAVALLLALRIETVAQALDAIDWNVILLYFGMLFVSEVFLYSKMPDYLATRIASRTQSVRLAMVLLCVFTGALSIMLENVAVVLLVAPIGLSIARKCGISPVLLFIGMAVSSNLQGAATLIGDPPSMLLAGFAKMNFNDFFVVAGRPSIFFAVQLAAIVSAIVLYFLFRDYERRMPPIEKEEHVSVVPTILVGLLVAALVAGSCIDHGFAYMAGTLCCVFGVLSFLWYLWHSSAAQLRDFVSKLDWQTGLFLIGVFVLVESLAVTGVMKEIADFILRVAGSRPVFVYVLIVGISVLVSAFVDNVPFLVAMLPVTAILVERTAMSPYLLYFGLLLGASIGGNITPIGASANIVAAGIIRKQGYPLKFMEFVRVGLPFTLASIGASALFVWLVFG
ncbi:MAG: SLC13 family permease [Planctomycetota bacterium]